MFLFSNKLDLNQEARFTIISLKKEVTQMVTYNITPKDFTFSLKFTKLRIEATSCNLQVLLIIHRIFAFF